MRRTHHLCSRGVLPHAALVLCLALAACADKSSRNRAPDPGLTNTAASSLVHPAGLDRSSRQARPRMVTPEHRLECVPYARRLSNIQIRGNAWTWWDTAEDRYERGTHPAVGSVLVLKRKGRSLGHLAVVTGIVSDREIVASHANWLNRGQIHLDTPIRDVSADNDWSSVRVWYTPGNVLGKSTYPAYGFIYPRIKTAAR